MQNHGLASSGRGGWRKREHQVSPPLPPAYLTCQVVGGSSSHIHSDSWLFKAAGALLNNCFLLAHKIKEFCADY